MIIEIKKYCVFILFMIICVSTSVYATNHIIEFGGTLGFNYDPNNLNVAVGDTVTWQGSFTSHPLSSTSVPQGAATFSKNSGTSFSYFVEITGTYNYKCDFHANLGMVGSFTAIVSSIKDGVLSGLPAVFDLKQNYPNPFNPSTTIRFSLPKKEFVELKVYNTLGKEVATIVSNELNQGNYSFMFNGTNLVSGVYYYQLIAGEYNEIKRMVLLK